MNGGKEGNQNLRPLVGRTTYSRINFDALDLIVRPQGVEYIRELLLPLVVRATPSDTGATTNRTSPRSLHVCPVQANHINTIT